MEFLHEECGQALEWAALGNGGVLIPGGIQEICGCGTKGHGLVMVLSRSGRWLDLMTSKVISKQKEKSFKGALPSF